MGDATNGDKSSPTSVSLGAGEKAKSINAGTDHTCAIMDDDSLKCWGLNDEGQLGDGTTVDKNTPSLIDLEPDDSQSSGPAKAVTGGNKHTCAILDDDSLKCWGENDSGQLGDGTTDDKDIPTPVDLGTGKTAVAVSAGWAHTCAILNDNTLKCWGRNNYGQLGDGTTDEKDTPNLIDLEPDDPQSSGSAKAVSAGGLHTCAILNDDTLKCWGDSRYGQLGIGTASSDTCVVSGSNRNCKKTPTKINLGQNEIPKAIRLGDSKSCLLFNNNALKCWGDNTYYQVDGTAWQRSAPTSVNLGTNKTAAAVNSGYYHTCAILNDDTLRCWGRNDYGQLGDGTTQTKTGILTIGF